MLQFNALNCPISLVISMQYVSFFKTAAYLYENAQIENTEHNSDYQMQHELMRQWNRK